MFILLFIERQKQALKTFGPNKTVFWSTKKNLWVIDLYIKKDTVESET